ncbi:hypothetical protein [Synechococcus sp. EJ6-Ellesmere]|nr:hypothetical protein [Synechococcus sp. EJ6-Ellesmere]
MVQRLQDAQTDQIFPMAIAEQQQPGVPWTADTIRSKGVLP